MRICPLPCLWLMTDAGRGDAAAAMQRLKRGRGVVYRDYERPDREARGRALRRLAKARGLVFLVAGDRRLALRLSADGVHAPDGLAARTGQRPHRRWIVTAAAHGTRGLVAARRAGVDGVFLSPVFATRSHPGAPTLGAVRFAAMVARAGLPVFALGGVHAGSWRRLNGAGAAGYGAIDALQKPSENSVNSTSASRSPT